MLKDNLFYTMLILVELFLTRNMEPEGTDTLEILPPDRVWKYARAHSDPRLLNIICHIYVCKLVLISTVPLLIGGRFQGNILGPR